MGSGPRGSGSVSGRIGWGRGSGGRGWGHGFWAPRLGLDQRTDRLLSSSSAPQLEDGDEVVKDVADLYHHYRQACSIDDDYDGALADWYARHGERAMRGEIALVRRTI